ncbi:hypothetical protein CXB51_002905 [Gossypium anomalum]|uniref:Aminotransferase-like plant mobile domain-containing protein n=1 Tax=Gossypium anomalum TaxID=47600 RepID=A0A8J6D9S7_9ROSI|nr:hypothetical protein CXB51_002905 [Gossypium anomalum]
MPDESYNIVHLRWLLLVDLKELGRLSWGLTVLMTLYQEMCRATIPDKAKISGCMLLLQAWTWYRLPFLCPRVELPYKFPFDLDDLHKIDLQGETRGRLANIPQKGYQDVGVSGDGDAAGLKFVISTSEDPIVVQPPDRDEIVTADVPFRRAESKYSVEQVGVTVEFYGGELTRVSYSDPCYSIRGIGLLLGMLHLFCFSSSDTFGMVLEPCSEMFLSVLIQIWMVKWNLEHSKNLEIQLQEDK